MYDMANIKKLRLLGEGAPSAWEGYKAFDKAAMADGAVAETFLPAESVPEVFRVRVLPSAATTMRPVVTALPPILLLSVRVRSSTLVYARESALGSPVSG